ncbi:MAG: M15 family metallopeptidase [Protaetiibacter sp.]
MSASHPSTPSRPSAHVRRRRRFAVLLTLALAVIAGLVVAIVMLLTPNPPQAEPTEAPTASETPSATPTPTPTPTFDTTAFSLTDPTSPWVIVNKLNPLHPVDYAPELRVVDVPYVYEPRMRPEAADAIERMFAAFTAETGLEMQSQSAYRSYQTQVGVYQGNDTLTARPGYSEHQTGWVMDISAKPLSCALQICFGQTPQGQWLAAHAYEYGFVIRYPDGKTDVTGYQYEPWHVRYVGTPLATEMHDTGVQTLEEFFGLPPAPNYP